MQDGVIFVFLAATLAINLTPGPSILFVSSVAASGGKVAGFHAVAGMSVAILIHVMAAASGITAIIAASEMAYRVLQYTGAAYLVYLGLRLLFSRVPLNTDTANLAVDTNWGYFRKGIVVDLLNPKIGLFFLAFFPQFMDQLAFSPFVGALFLGFLFVVLGGIVNSVVAVSVSTGTTMASPAIRPLIEKWLPGGVLVVLGVRLACQEV